MSKTRADSWTCRTLAAGRVPSTRERRPDDSQALDVPELAKWLNISEWKARDLGKDPLFPSFRVGREHRFWASAVRTYLSQPRDPWKQPTQSLGRKRKRDGDGPSRLRRMRS